MGERTLIIQVPTTDRKELDKLITRLEHEPGDVLESRAFDGATVLTLLVSVSAGTAAVLRTWLITRATTRKSTKVTIDGKHFEGYTKNEVLAIMAAIGDSDDGE
jgi:hypothetical protein